MNRSDFQQLAELRIQEAEALLAGNLKFPDGAYYLAGYAVECALKACIAKGTKEFDFPEKKRTANSYTHDLDDLFILADLRNLREIAEKGNQALRVNWTIVKDWSEETRYQRGKTDKEVSRFLLAITDPINGVLPWIKLHW